MILDAGFEIARQSEVTLTEEQVKMLYDSKKDEEYFDELVAQMTAGPCLVLCLAKVAQYFHAYEKLIQDRRNKNLA